MNLRRRIKRFRYLAEYQIVRLAFWLFMRLKPQTASNVGSKIARFVGKRISVNKLAYDNMSKAIPTLTHSKKLQIVDDMWDNLGRIVGEFGHIAKFGVKEAEDYYEISKETEENIKQMAESKTGGIMVGAHIGNWEIGPKVFMKHGLDVSAVYRPLNNPYVEKLTTSSRVAKMISKSTKGSRQILQEIKKGGYVVILADQKVSEGEPVKFFHDDAITTTSIARIALKYDVPIIPSRSIRIGKEFKFIVEIKKPIDFTKSSDIDADVIDLTRKINVQLEDWIKQHPSQWFWVHNRWKR